MAFEVLNQISTIEREGEQLIRNAQLQAAEILREAKARAEAMVQEAKKEAEDYYNNVILRYESEANEAVKPIFRDSHSIEKNITKIHDELLDKAVNMVIERIVNSHGNS